MTQQVRLSDLGIPADDRVFSGATPADVIGQVAEYLRTEHGIKLPDADTILGDEPHSVVAPTGNLLGTHGSTPTAVVNFTPPLDPGAEVIIRRLRQALQIEPDQTARPGTPKVAP